MTNWYNFLKISNNLIDDPSNKYVDEILVEEARSFSNSGNNHRLNQILANYLGAAQMLERGSSAEIFGPMSERGKKKLEDFILAEKLKRR